MKQCAKCKKEKELFEFFNNKKRKDGKSSYCKVCHSLEGQKRYTKEKSLENYYNNKDIILKAQRNAYKADNSTKLNYRKNNKEKISITLSKSHKKWYAKNREKKLLQNKLYNQKREAIDPEYKLRRRLRSRLTSALKNYNIKVNKQRNINKLIGCELKELKKHLENMFRDQMNWNNHGTIWHIDHIIPCSKFNLLDIEEQSKCFHYSNLQPLLVLENLKKSNK